MTKNYGIEGTVLHDDDPLDPTVEYDSLGTMICNHSRYNLGHVQGNPADHLQKGDIVLPLYLMDHSGLSISTKPFSCAWDSGRLGVIYVTQEDLKKEGMSKEQALLCMEGEVETYNNYLTSNCFGYVIENAYGEILESCWGFLGEEYCESEMNSVLSYIIAKKKVEIDKRDKAYTVDDWIHEVLSHSTILGLEEWRQHIEESNEG
jgi:hypothetical protein